MFEDSITSPLVLEKGGWNYKRRLVPSGLSTLAIHHPDFYTCKKMGLRAFESMINVMNNNQSLFYDDSFPPCKQLDDFIMGPNPNLRYLKENRENRCMNTLLSNLDDLSGSIIILSANSLDRKRGEKSDISEFLQGLGVPRSRETTANGSSIEICVTGKVTWLGLPGHAWRNRVLESTYETEGRRMVDQEILFRLDRAIAVVILIDSTRPEHAYLSIYKNILNYSKLFQLPLAIVATKRQFRGTKGVKFVGSHQMRKQMGVDSLNMKHQFRHQFFTYPYLQRANKFRSESKTLQPEVKNYKY